MWSTILHSPVFQGAMTGFVSAAAVDYHAFTTWKTPEEAKAYNWSVAAWRWFQGTVIGLVTGAGFAGFA